MAPLAAVIQSILIILSTVGRGEFRVHIAFVTVLKAIGGNEK